MVVSPDELKRAALLHAEFLWENSSDGHLLVDAEGRFVMVNRTVEEKTGFPRQELLGKNFLDSGLLSLASQELVKKNFVDRMQGKKIPPYEVEALDKFGEKLHYELNATPILKDGKPIGEYVILRDLTERKKLEASLRREIKLIHATVLQDARDFLLELGSLQSFLSDLEKKCTEAESGKLHEAVRMTDELDSLVRRLIEKMSH
jgi:PAS domain S-box-containing protein